MFQCLISTKVKLIKNYEKIYSHIKKKKDNNLLELYLKVTGKQKQIYKIYFFNKNKKSEWY